MNKLNDDKKVLKRRKNALEVEESLQDKIDNRLMDLLDEDQIGLKVNSMWSADRADKAEWLERQEEYLSNYDNFLDIDPQGLFESSSNLRVPMSLWVAKTFHARFLQTLISPEPSLSVKARKSQYADVEQDIEEFMKYTLTEWTNGYQGIEETLDKWVWQWVTTGIGYLKNRWDKRYEKHVAVEKQKQRGPNKFVVDPVTGNEIEVPTEVEVEREKEVVTEIFNGPQVEMVLPEDLAVIGEDKCDIDGADAVIHRHWVTASDLWTMVDRGMVDEDVVEEIIAGGDITKSGSEGGMLKQARQQNSGEASLDKTYDHDRYEILEAYVSLDVDGSGINTDVVIWTDTKTKSLLRATYLRKVYKSGRRPFSASFFHKRSGTNDHMPVGLIEMLASIQRELDAMHNMRIDFGLISTMPFGFYRASSSIDPVQIPLEPGQLIPVDNPNDIVFPNLGNRTLFGQQEEMQLYTMVERLTGISDLSLGSMSGRQGATRTASGVRALIAESNINLDVPLKRLNRGWKRTLENILDMVQQRTPKDFEYRVPSGQGFARYMRIMGEEDLAGDYAIEVSPTTSASNPQIRLENATQILQIVQNPLLIQTGVVTPQNIYEGVSHYLKIIGVKEPSRFINGSFAEQYVLTPEEELNRILALNPAPVLPNSDHEGFIAFATEKLKDDSFVESIDQAQLAAVSLAMKQHQQMMQALQQQQAQQANLNQQMQNSQNANNRQSAPAAPVGNIQGGEGNVQ